MTDIKTLVDDIYVLKNKGLTDEEIEANSEIFAEFGQQLAESLKRALSRKEDKRTLRLSSIGYPLRKAWYAANGYEMEPLLPHTRIKFFYGDMLESYILALAKLSGHEVTGEQDELVLHDIVGHRDAVIDGCTVDVKSASRYGFAKFQDGLDDSNDSFKYREQLRAYQLADPETDQDKSYNLVIQKELGHLYLAEFKSEDMPDVEAHMANVKEAIKADVPPPRCYKPVPFGKSGNMVLGVECSYCPWKRECWKDMNGGKGLRTFLYSNGPKDFVYVKKRPDVMEVSK